MRDPKIRIFKTRDVFLFVGCVSTVFGDTRDIYLYISLFFNHDDLNVMFI